jgi:phage-related protein
MQSFHKTVGPALGIPLMAMSSNPSSDPFSSVFGSVFGGITDAVSTVFGGITSGISDVWNLGKDTVNEVIHLPTAVLGAGTAAIGTAGTTITGVAHEAGGAVGNVTGAAKDIFSSPILLIGGAAVLLILLSR